MSDQILNEQGYVAMKWIFNRPAPPVKIADDDTVYNFDAKMNIRMAWVKPEHVERLLAIRDKVCNCNNGTYRNPFMLANQLDVNLWVYGNREGV